MCTNFPYDVAAAALIVTEAGGVVTAADGGPLADRPAVGSGEGYGVAVLASASAALHEQLLDAVGSGDVAVARAPRAGPARTLNQSISYRRSGGTLSSGSTHRVAQ